MVFASELQAGSLSFTALKYKTNLDTKVTTAQGNVRVEMNEKVLIADEVKLFGMEGNVEATGNVLFTQETLSIKADRIKINLDTGFGEFDNYILRVGTDVYMEGLYLKRYLPDRYQTKNAKLTRCQDCPQSWSIYGDDMDLEIEQYARIHNALFQVKDYPVAYVPYVLFPVKTQRQSGFLIPQYAYSQDLGWQMRTPYFQVWKNNADSTFEYHYMSEGGHRLNTEHRYVYSDRTYVTAQPSMLYQTKSPRHRYGASIQERWQINRNAVQRYRGEIESDTRYSRHFKENFQGALLPSLVNEPSISYQGANYSTYGLMQFHRDNLSRQIPESQEKYSLGAIHKFPEVSLGVPSLSLLGPVRLAANAGFVKYSRGTEEVDVDTGWIRSGDRATGVLALTAPMSPTPYLTWKPLVETRADSYRFYVPGEQRSAYRVRTLLDQKLEMPLSRVYAVGGKDLKAMRHYIIPALRWSYSPPEVQSKHRFFTDKDSPKFDLLDPNSEVASVNVASQSATEEQRLKYHHFLTYGTSTKLIGRLGEATRTYQEFLYANVERDYSLINKTQGRLRVYARGTYWGLTASTQLAINTATGYADATSQIAYTQSEFDISAGQKVGGDPNQGTKTNAYTLGAGLRVIKNWAIAAVAEYDAVREKWGAENYQALFNSDSKCWQLSVGFTKVAGQNGFDFSPKIHLIFKEGMTL